MWDVKWKFSRTNSRTRSNSVIDTSQFQIQAKFVMSGKNRTFHLRPLKVTLKWLDKRFGP